MSGLTYCGSWRLTVVSKVSDWAQRVVVTGSVNGVIPGQVGVSVLIAGDRWQLAIEHNLGGVWVPNQRVAAGPLRHEQGRPSQLISSKDQYWPGDTAPNDLILHMENVGAAFDVVDQYAVDAALRPLPDRALAGRMAQYLAVEVRNTGHQTFGYDTVLDISDAGRHALAEHGVQAQDGWSPAAVRATGQEVFGRAVALPPLEVGDRATAYFPVDATVSRAGTPEVEFVLLRAGDSEGRVAPRRRSVHPVPTGDAEDRENDLNVPVEPLDLELVRGLEVLRSRAARSVPVADGRPQLLDVAATAARPEDEQAPSTRVQPVAANRQERTEGSGSR